MHDGASVYLALLGAAACVAALTAQYLSALRAAALVRAEPPVYQEWFASGHSRKNIFTRFGGAHSCLRLVVTSRHLWITAWPPFGLLAQIYDLEHVIPLERILSVAAGRFLWWNTLLITFTDDRGCSHTLRIFPRHASQFLNALALPPGKEIGRAHV